LIVSTSLAHECGISNPTEEQSKEGIAPLGKWPWQVYVRTPGSFCGGTIIAERWILTAAHCFDAQLAGETFDKDPLIRTGVVDVEKASKDDFQYKNVYGVNKFYAHEEYNKENMVNDIALLELERPINYSSTVAPICLAHADQDVDIKHEGWIVGFGTYIDDETKTLVDEISNVLRETRIPLSRHSECKTEWSDVEMVICAGGKGIGAGEGDSGGPLMLQSVDGPWYQVGVVSYGKNDTIIANEHTIGAYTSVGHYCDWIEKVTGGEGNCAEKGVEMKEMKEEVSEGEGTESADVNHEESTTEGNDEETTESTDDDEKTKTTDEDDEDWEGGNDGSGDDEDDDEEDGDSDDDTEDEAPSASPIKMSLFTVLSRSERH
ncbi:hypothetical protein PENTCL1PPCAC_27950, partial [Pristionchus entomophagus]